MSTTIDEKVVEMRFDNSKFEKNVEQSMSTLDKLKAKLNFSGATKSLEELDAKTKNVGFDRMAQSVEALEKRFSTTGIVGMRVIQNLTDQAMVFMSKVNSFVTSGIINGGLNRAFNLENAQFQLLGLLKDADAVSAVMKNVSDSVDGTAYSLDAAATVASQLAASGMRAGDQMFSSLRAVAGVAAMTNSSYQDIGRIFTQVAGQGRLMGNDLLQLSGRGMNAAATIAEYLNTTEGEVRDMVSKGKISFEIFSNAMDSAFGEHAKKANETFNGAMSNIKASLARIGAMFVSPLIKSNGPMVEMFNTIREKVNDIKKNLEPVAEVFSGAATKVVNAATGFIAKIDVDGFFSKFSKAAKSSPFEDLANKIKEVTTASSASAEAVQDLGDVVNRVINGEFGNAPERYEKLTAAGFDWAAVQNKVNEQLGDSTRHAEAAATAQESLNQTQAVTIDALKAMSDAELKNIGFTDDQVAAFRELEQQSAKTGIPIEELMTNVDKLSAKSLLLDSFKNIGESLVNTFKAMGTAWGEIFNGKGENTSSIIYSLIESFHKLTTKFKVNDEEADKLRRTFKGLFAVIDLITTIVGGGFKMGLKVINAVLSVFNLDILDVTAAIGDFAVKVHDFIEDNDVFGKTVETVASGAKLAAEGIKALADAFMSIPQVKELAENLKSLDFKEIGSNIIDGLHNGISEGLDNLPGLMSELGEKLLSAIKEVLGIHSPSTEMYDVGTNAVQGLINGIESLFGPLWESAKRIGSTVIEAVKSVDFSQFTGILAAGGLIYMVRILSKALDRIGDVTSVFANAGKVLKSVSGAINEIGLGIKKNLDAGAFKTRMSAINDIIKSLVLLAGAVIVLAQLNITKMWSAVGAIAVLAIIVGALAAVTARISKESATIDWKAGINVQGMQTALLSLGVCILAISEAVKQMGQLEPDQFKQGAKGMVSIIAMIGALIIAVQESSRRGKLADFTSFAKMIQKLSTSLLLIAVIVKILGKMSTDELEQGLGFIALFTAFSIALVGATGFLPDKDVEQFGNLMLKLAGALALTAIATKVIGNLSDDEINKADSFLIGFGSFIAGMAVITNLITGGDLDEFGSMMLKISVSVAIMAIAVKLIGKLKYRDMRKGVVFLGGFTAFLALWKKILTSNKGTEIAKMGTTLLAISASLLILVGVCALIGMLSPSALAKGVIVIGLLSAFMAGMISATNGASECKGSIMAMAVAIGIMAASIAILSLIDPKKLVAPTLAMAALMGMFSLMELAGSKMQKNMATIIAMTVAIGVIAACLAVLSDIGDTNAMIAAAAGISLVMLSMSASLAIISTFAKSANDALIGIGLMSVVIVGIGLAMSALAQCEWQNTLAAATGISMVLLSMVAALALLGLAGEAAIAAAPSVGMITLVVAVLTGLLYILAQCDPTAAIASAASLSLLLISMSATLLLLSAVGALASLAMAGVTALLTFVGIMSAVLLVLGGLAQIPGLQGLVEDGGGLLASIGYAIGDFIGSIIGGLSAGISDGLPALAENLSAFAEGIQPFVTTMSSIDAGTFLSNVGAFTGAIMLLIAAEFINGIASFVMHGEGMALLGQQLSAFMVNAMPFIAGVSLLNAEAMSGIESLAKAILILTAADLLSGITAFIGGKSSLSEFGESLEPFGEAIAGFSTAVKDVDGEAVQNAADAGLAIAKMAKEIPNSGGLISKIVGDNDMGDFATDLTSFGTAIAGFSDAVKDHIDGDAVQAAADAGQLMINLAKDIPNSGGIISFITGDNDMGDFANKLKDFGDAIVDFSDTVKDKVDSGAVESAANAAQLFVELNNAMPDTGGVKGWWNGDNDMGDFGKQLVKLGNGIVDFSDTVKGSIDTKSIDTAIDVSNDLVSFAKDLKGVKFDNVSKLSESISYDFSGISTGLLTLSTNLQDFKVSSVTGAITACEKMVNFASELTNTDTSVLSSFGDTLKKFADQLAGVDTSSISSFSSKMKDLGKTGVTNILEAFKGSSAKASTAGQALAKDIANGVNKGTSEIVKAFTQITMRATESLKKQRPSFIGAMKVIMSGMSSAVTSEQSTISNNFARIVKAAINSTKGYRGDFYNIGANFAKGMASGISDNDYRVEAKAKAMAKKAATAAQKALDIHSPSRVMRAMGKYIPMGLAMGIDEFSYLVGNSSKSMAQQAADASTTAIASFSALLDSNDDWSPTIKPVVDMTDVNDSASIIDNLFSGDHSFGLYSTVAPVVRKASYRTQNSGNADVITAINGLRKDIGNLSNTTYQIDGITYDDGSNIADAISTLIGAVQTERRI